jgi:RNA polymerase sigma-70 factor (ECF subfamily)
MTGTSTPRTSTPRTSTPPTWTAEEATAEEPAPHGGARRTSSVPDAVLVRRAATGDHAAFDALYRRYDRVVTSIVSSETRRQSDVADIVQEAFTLAWRRLGSLREPERFRPWLLQITRRSVIEHARRAARRPALDADDDASLALVTADDPGPSDWHELAELSRRLSGALDGMSRRDATVVTLAAQFGFGPVEIAAAIGTTPNTAKVVLHRARTRLRAAAGL